MSISRDEAREIAIAAILLTIVVRLTAGLLQMTDELIGSWTFGSLADRLFAPVGSTIGMLALAAAMIVVLSPTGSVAIGVIKVVRWTAAVVAVVGILAALHTITRANNNVLAGVWFAMINGLAAAILGGTAWWILTNFNGDR